MSKKGSNPPPPPGVRKPPPPPSPPPRMRRRENEPKRRPVESNDHVPQTIRIKDPGGADLFYCTVSIVIVLLIFWGLVLGFADIGREDFRPAVDDELETVGE